MISATLFGGGRGQHKGGLLDPEGGCYIPHGSHTSFDESDQTPSKNALPVCVAYFEQRLGAAHSKLWSKSAFLHFSNVLELLEIE